MITITFNTTTKNVIVKENTTILYQFTNVPTVKVKEEGFYEVMKENQPEESSRVPVARFPIANSIMIIEK